LWRYRNADDRRREKCLAARTFTILAHAIGSGSHLFAQLASGIPSDNGEAPRPRATMIRRAHSEIEGHLNIGPRDSGTRESTRGPSGRQDAQRRVLLAENLAHFLNRTELIGYCIP